MFFPIFSLVKSINYLREEPLDMSVRDYLNILRWEDLLIQLQHSPGSGSALCKTQKVSWTQPLSPSASWLQLQGDQLLWDAVTMASQGRHHDVTAWWTGSPWKWTKEIKWLLSGHLIAVTETQQRHRPNSWLSDSPTSGEAEPPSAWEQARYYGDHSNGLLRREGSNESESQRIRYWVSHGTWKEKTVAISFLIIGRRTILR